MRGAYQKWIKPGASSSQQRALQALEQGQATPFMQVVDLEETMPDKMFLYQAAFCFQSDRAIYFENLLLMNNLARRYRSTIELLEILPQENWTPRCFVSAFHAYNRLDCHREATAAFEKMEDRYKTDKIRIDAALCYARLGNFQSANIAISPVPAEVRSVDMNALKLSLLQALNSDERQIKVEMLSIADEASKRWDDEVRFLVAKLAIQTENFRRAEGLYARESGSRPENRTKYFYEIMVILYLATDEKSKARKMLIEGQGKLRAPFLQETCNQLARNYFMVQHPGTRLALLELYENLPGVKWENEVLAAVASGYYHQGNWERVIAVAEKIPFQSQQWEYGTLVVYVEACGRTGQQAKVDALAGRVSASLLRSAIADWQERQDRPERIERELLRANSLVGEQRYAEAAGIYRAVERRQLTLEATYNYLLCLFHLRNYRYARDFLHQWIGKEHWDDRLARLAAEIDVALARQIIDPSFGQAMQAVQECEWERAITLFRQIPVDEWNNEIVRQLIFCYRKLDRLQDARNLLTAVWTEEKWNDKIRRIARGLGLDVD